MEPPKEGFSMEQPAKRDRGRPQRTVRESQPSEESSSIPSFDEGMKGISEPARPSAHGHRPSMFNWVGTITQAMVTAVGPSFNSCSRRLEAVKMVETDRSMGAQEFRGTTKPVQAEEWIRRIERIFEVMECRDERKVNIATFLLGGQALNWWNSYNNRQLQGVEVT